MRLREREAAGLFVRRLRGRQEDALEGEESLVDPAEGDLDVAQPLVEAVEARLDAVHPRFQAVHPRVHAVAGLPTPSEARGMFDGLMAMLPA